MARLNTKKELEKFSNNLKQLSANLNDITTNVDDINNQFDNYGEQISGIKDDVKSLESELKQFMQEVKISPLIERAKRQIDLDKEELEKNYSKHNTIREKLLTIIDHINNDRIDDNYLLTNEELSNLNIPDFYLSYVLLSINSWINDNKKSANKSIKQAIKLDKEKTSLLLTLFNYYVNRESAFSKWLNYYLDNIDITSTNDNIVKLINHLIGDEDAIKIIAKKIEKLLKNDNNDTVKNDLFKYLDNNFRLEDKKEEFPFLRAYCEKCTELIEEMNYSKKYESIYNKFSNWIKNSNNDYDFIYGLIYSYDGRERELKNDILKNEYIIKNNGKSRNIVPMQNKHILYVFLTSLNNKKICRKTKEILLEFLKPYFLEYIDQMDNNYENDEIKIQMGDWIGFTKNGSNENELADEIDDFLRNPVKEEIEKIKFFNYKSIYSLSFSLVGVIVSLFNSILGIPMILMGLVMTGIILYGQKNIKADKMLQTDVKIDTYVYELYNLLAEITDIKITINRNYNYKEIVLNYFYDLGEGEKNE